MPEGLEDEEELDEDYSEGDQAGEEDGLRTADVPCLDGELAGEGRGFGGVLPCSGFHVAVPAPCVYKRDLDTEPEEDDGDECSEGESG